jgi:hypothetical protein
MRPELAVPRTKVKIGKMMAKKSPGKSLEDVVAVYIDNLGQYLLTHQERRWVDGNKYADRVWEAAKLLRHKFGAKGRATLVGFLDHDDAGFRSSAAAATIDFATGRATKVLEAIEKAVRPFEATAAHCCLRNWREGSSRLPGGPVTLDPNENYEQE